MIFNLSTWSVGFYLCLHVQYEFIFVLGKKHRMQHFKLVMRKHNFHKCFTNGLKIAKQQLKRFPKKKISTDRSFLGYYTIWESVFCRTKSTKESQNKNATDVTINDYKGLIIKSYYLLSRQILKILTLNKSHAINFNHIWHIDISKCVYCWDSQFVTVSDLYVSPSMLCYVSPCNGLLRYR